MPLYVRHLPSTVSNVIDRDTLPKNVHMLNPSIAYPVLYLRAITMTPEGETNSVSLHNMETKETHIVTPPDMMPNVNFYQGIEDMRIVWFKDRLWFTATCTHASLRMTNELLVGVLAGDLKTIERMSVIDIGSLPVKNVCPFVHDGKLKLFDIYKQCMYLIGENDKGEFCVTEKQQLRCGAGIDVTELRSSTTPIHLFGNTWGCVVHDIIFNDNSKMINKLSYMHYWLEFDIGTQTVTFLSSPFWISHWGVEFVSGIHFNRDTDVVTLYFGVQDKMPKYAKTTIGDLRIGK
jgi:hypothetical protein